MEQVNKWVSVRDHLPEEGRDVIVWNGMEYCIANLWRMGDVMVYWSSTTDGYNYENIIAWSYFNEYKE